MYAKKQSSEGGKSTTSLAKFLRILRINREELIGEMAEKIGVKPAYLSAIEANRRPLTAELARRLIAVYGLTESEQNTLYNAMVEASRSLEITFDCVKEEALLADYVDTARIFARDLCQMNGAELEEIRKLLQKFHPKEQHGTVYQNQSN